MLTVPMVLHGASGLSEEAVRECIRRGICKVNFATELRIAYSDGMKAGAPGKARRLRPQGIRKSRAREA
jgi:tagatose 1,6-diphosphate aldolase GatY/KbaY